MSTFDIIFLVIILLSLGLGLMRGFITEIFAIGKWILAIWLTLRFGGMLSTQLIDVLPSSFAGFSFMLSRVVVFVGALVILMVLESFVQSAAGNAGLGKINRLFGGLVGIVRGIILCLVVVWIGGLAKQQTTDAWKSSVMMPYFTNLYDSVLHYSKSRMTGFGTVEDEKNNGTNTNDTNNAENGSANDGTAVK